MSTQNNDLPLEILAMMGTGDVVPPEPTKPAPSAEEEQHLRHVVCAETYLQTLNKGAAARAANYSRPTLPDSKIFKEVLAKRAAKHVSNLEITTERVLLEYARVAFLDPRDLFDEDGLPIPITELPEDVTRTLAGIEVTALGQADGFARVTKYRILDKLKALDALGKYLGIAAPERHEHEIGFNLDGMSLRDKARRVAFMLVDSAREVSVLEGSTSNGAGSAT